MSDEKMYDKQAIIEGLRQKLDTPVIDFAKAILELPEGDLHTITFADIFRFSSINNPDECLDAMIEHIEDFREEDRKVYLKIGEIQELLHCNRSVLSKTLHFLEMKGGMNGWQVIPMGDRRGKKYHLCKVER